MLEVPMRNLGTYCKVKTSGGIIKSKSKSYLVLYSEIIYGGKNARFKVALMVTLSFALLLKYAYKSNTNKFLGFKFFFLPLHKIQNSLDKPPIPQKFAFKHLPCISKLLQPLTHFLRANTLSILKKFSFTFNNFKMSQAKKFVKFL